MIGIEQESILVLTRDIVLPIILSTVASVLYVIRSGWKGFADFAACWFTACFCGVMGHWVAMHYGITGNMNAVIVSMTALLSHLIMDILFHPQIREAIKRRLINEILTRGVALTKKERE